MENGVYNFKLNIDWKLGSAATALDTTNHTITLASGETIAFDGLIIATSTGSTAPAGVSLRPRTSESTRWASRRSRSP